MCTVTRLLPAVLHAPQLPLPELCAARLDGEVYAIDECYAPIDEVPDARLRAAAVRALAGDRAVAERDSALWIYGIRAEPPHRHTLCVPRDHRVTLERTPRTIVRETRLQAGDTQWIGGLAVTTPVRTGFDLLRSTEFGAADHDALVALIARFGVDVRACRDRILTVRNLPGRHTALARLDALGRPDLS